MFAKSFKNDLAKELTRLGWKVAACDCDVVVRLNDGGSLGIPLEYLPADAADAAEFMAEQLNRMPKAN